MATNDSLKDISKKINDLLDQHNAISDQIQDLQKKLNKLKVPSNELEEVEEKNTSQAVNKEIVQEKSKSTIKEAIIKEELLKTKRKITLPLKADLEQFIGANIINKVGILILLIGVAIGTKFVIDRELITPLTRLILGYLIGFSLLFFAYRLKEKYFNFSVVLFAGAMSIAYFMTYAGMIYFEFFKLSLTFSVMVIITVLTVFQSLKYNRQVISIIGLIGAYAIPFLIGGETDNYGFLFSYIAIINIGILILSIKRYWRLQYYLSFAFTWIIFITWWQNIDITSILSLKISFLFSTIFFLLFYISFLGYKLLYKKLFSFEDVILIVTNSFIFYAVGYYNLNSHDYLDTYASVFTIANALLHGIVFLIISKWDFKDLNLQYLVAGMAILFITITIPVQFNANWITLFWFFEGTVLFVIGRTNRTHFYEYLAYPIFVFSFYSIFSDWINQQGMFQSTVAADRITPFLNIYFLTGMICVLLLVLVNYIHTSYKYPVSKNLDDSLKSIIDIFLPGLLLVILFFSIKNEISGYWEQALLISNAKDGVREGAVIMAFKGAWNVIYTVIFFSVLTYVLMNKIKDNAVLPIVFVLNGIVLLIFCGLGLSEFSELRSSYLNPDNSDLYKPGIMQILIRYIGILSCSILIYLNYILAKAIKWGKWLNAFISIFTHLIILWILSSELLHWLEFFDVKNSNKLGLSIFWGSYAVFIIVLGIWKKIKFLRIGGICLFGLTLIKLFFYDLTELDTFSKTIIFIVLGILLLIVSYLYNRYQRIIAD